jgi:glutamine synthetase type III
MNIAKKLSTLGIGVFLVFAILCTVLLRQMEVAFARYDAVIAEPVRQMDEARVIQVTFKRQVQEWKDILLRGHNEADLWKYTKNFNDDELQVRTQVVALVGEVRDPAARDLLEKFLDAHKAMSARYHEAYEFYVRDVDFKTADRMVRGQDRAPTDLFDAVVQRLEQDARNKIEAQQAASKANIRMALALSTFVLTALGLIGFMTVRRVLCRIGKLREVADRLAAADLNGLCIDVSGEDEIGRFGESMKGVHAAIEELLSISITPVSL